MNKIEKLEKKLEELKEEQFKLDMIDTWDDKDYTHSQELHTKIVEIENKISLEKELKSIMLELIFMRQKEYWQKEDYDHVRELLLRKQQIEKELKNV